jgi:hypothetical protein
MVMGGAIGAVAAITTDGGAVAIAAGIKNRRTERPPQLAAFFVIVTCRHLPRAGRCPVGSRFRPYLKDRVLFYPRACPNADKPFPLSSGPFGPVKPARSIKTKGQAHEKDLLVRSRGHDAGRHILRSRRKGSRRSGRWRRWRFQLLVRTFVWRARTFFQRDRPRHGHARSLRLRPRLSVAISFPFDWLSRNIRHDAGHADHAMK